MDEPTSPGAAAPPPADAAAVPPRSSASGRSRSRARATSERSSAADVAALAALVEQARTLPGRTRATPAPPAAGGGAQVASLAAVFARPVPGALRLPVPAGVPTGVPAGRVREDATGAEQVGAPLALPFVGAVSRRLLRDAVETIALTFAIFFIVQNVVAQPFQVQQVSMERTFEPGQFVLVDKLSPRWDAFARGDVIVFEPPEDWSIERTPFIKRVVGVGGDRIEVRDGRVWVNGTALEESYTYRNDVGEIEPTEPERAETSWTVPAGSLFVMGDHRQASLDSRAFGPIAVGNVIGRVSVRYWPISSFGIMEAPTY